VGLGDVVMSFDEGCGNMVFERPQTCTFFSTSLGTNYNVLSFGGLSVADGQTLFSLEATTVEVWNLDLVPGLLDENNRMLQRPAIDEPVRDR